MPQGMPLITKAMLSEKLRSSIEGGITVNNCQEYSFVATSVGTQASIVGGNITGFNAKSDYLAVYVNGKKIPSSKYTVDGATITFTEPYIIDDTIDFVRISNSLVNLENIGATFGVYDLKHKIIEDTDKVTFIPEFLGRYIEQIDTILVVTNTVVLELNEHFRISDDLTYIIPLDSEGNDTVWKAGTELYIYYFRT